MKKTISITVEIWCSCSSFNLTERIDSVVYSYQEQSTATKNVHGICGEGIVTRTSPAEGIYNRDQGF